jgi:dihydrofolate reductase
MGKLIVTEFVSIDGVFENPHLWTFDFSSDEQNTFKYNETMASDALLLGRVTYEGFAQAWPERSGDPFSDKFNTMPKYVASTTLENPTWTNSHVIQGDLAPEIRRLKGEYTGDIAIHGSGELVNSLVPLGVIDEYRLMVFPVVLGEGKRLFREGVDRKTLHLIDTLPTSTGVIVLTYQPADAADAAAD